MTSCAYCRTPLAPGPPWAPGEGHRLAYDPHKGRLWTVCSGCSRWNLTPMESRWESLEACEEAVARSGKVLLGTEHLSLIDLGAGVLIRVGRAPRPEFVDWRYGPLAHDPGPRPGLLARILSGLPPPPVDGYDPYGHVLRPVTSRSWLASPFLEAASPLTYLFSQVPLAPKCPSCGQALALRPWEFQGIRFTTSGPSTSVVTPCGLCGDQVAVAVSKVRPPLRLGLSLVTPLSDIRELSTHAAEALEQLGGGEGFLRSLSHSGSSLGEMSPLGRAGLIISLDELAETEALEAEWREAEELASIMDGELTDVPGFVGFRREILGEDD